MKVTFDKAKLLAALIPLSGISQTKNTLTSVEGLLFECPPVERYGKFEGDADTTCRISAFDLQKGMQTTVDCSIKEQGIYVINTSKILQIIKVMPDGDVTIEIDERNRVKVIGGQSSFEITAQNGMDFPTMPKFIGEKIYTIPQHILKDIINETVFSVAQNDQRPMFTGALLRISDGNLTMVGCDGERLAAAKTVFPADVPDMETIIPGKFLLELTKMLEDSEDEITMIMGRKHVIFEIGEFYFFVRVIEAAYIQYEKILPTTYRALCYVSRRELLGAIERASLITEDRFGGNSKPYVKMVFGKSSISISSVSSNGSVFEEIPCALEGEEMTMGFQCRFLADSLRAMPGDEDSLRIRLNTPSLGILIEPSCGTDFTHAVPDPEVFGDRVLDVVPDDKESKDTEYLYLIMPRRMHN